MKITGSGPTEVAGSPDEPPKLEKPAGGAFAEKLGNVDKAEGPAATAGSEKSAPASEPRLTGDIGAALQKKEITPEAAVDQVMSRILDRQIGSAASPGTRAKVETALRDAIESDPVLSAKVKSLAD